MHQQIRQFILSNFLFTDDESQLKDSDSLLERGVMDSTGALELVAFIEEHFGIAVDDADLVPENLESVDRIVAFVGRKRPSGARPTLVV